MNLCRGEQFDKLLFSAKKRRQFFTDEWKTDANLLNYHDSLQVGSLVELGIHGKVQKLTQYRLVSENIACGQVQLWVTRESDEEQSNPTGRSLVLRRSISRLGLRLARLFSNMSRLVKTDFHQEFKLSTPAKYVTLHLGRVVFHLSEPIDSEHYKL